MEVQLARGLLPLLLLAWLPAGLASQPSATIGVSVGLDVILQCLIQNSTAGEVKWFNITHNNGGKQNESEEMEERSACLLFRNVNEAHAGTYACRMKSTGRGSQPEESDVPTECRFNIWSEDLVVYVRWYKPEDLEMRNQINTVALRENCTKLTSSDGSAASVGICGCKVFITRTNLTDTRNGTQEAVPTYGPGALQTNVTEKETWTSLCAGLYYPLCIIFGLVVGTLLYTPIICFLLWQRRRNRKGKLTSGQVAEENQLSTAAPVTGTEDLTYANLKFEKKGTKPTSSDIVYTEIKPLQQQQKSGDAGAADAGVDVSPEGDGK